MSYYSPYYHGQPSSAPTHCVDIPSPTPIPRRSRLQRSCAECRRLKIKCDRNAPCGSCTFRDARCVYTPAATAKADQHSLLSRISRVESLLAEVTASNLLLHNLYSQLPGPSTQRDRPLFVVGQPRPPPAISPNDTITSWLNELNLDQDILPVIPSPSYLPRDLTGQVTKSSSHPFASGGFGDIYKGNLNMGGRLINVAIKTAKVYLQHDHHLPKKMKQFRREITVWSKLKHPNVLPLLGTIRDPSMHPEIPAMVCPWIENGALTTYLEGNDDLTVARRFVLINDVAHGLRYLHSQHVIHGDLSGSNVLVGGGERACIADFGLSTLLTQLSGSTFVTTQHVRGTMRWMAPELLDPADDSPATPTGHSDVYSFGSIMLQILTGSIPYYYLSRNEQVVFAIARGMQPRRPDIAAVTNRRWEFIERCWSPLGASQPRPSSDEITEFTWKELAEIMAAGLAEGPTTLLA